MRLIYFSLVHSHTFYGILSWGSKYSSTLNSLQILQNKIVRIMSNVRQDSHVTNHSLFRNLGILNIKHNYQLELAKFMHHYHDNKLSLLFKGYFVPLENIHSYNTRANNNNSYFLPRFSSNATKNSLYSEGVKIWNGIPETWKKFSYQKFISMYKNHLLDQYNDH